MVDLEELLKKRLLGEEKYSQLERKKILDANAEDASGLNWRAGIAALGEGIAGRAPSLSTQILKDQESARQKKLDEFDVGAKESSADTLKIYELLSRKAEKEAELKRRQEDSAQASADKRFIADQASADKRFMAGLVNDGRQNRAELAANNRGQAYKRLSSKEIGTLGTADKAIKEMEFLIEQSNLHPEYTGPLDGRIPKEFQKAGQSAFLTDVGDAQALNRLAMTGMGGGEAESKRLAANLPDKIDKDENFIAKANATIERIKRQRDSYVNTLKKAGKNVDAFIEDPDSYELDAVDQNNKGIPQNPGTPQTQAPSASPGSTGFPKIVSNGTRTFKINNEKDYQTALKKGYR